MFSFFNYFQLKRLFVFRREAYSKTVPPTLTLARVAKVGEASVSDWPRVITWSGYLTLIGPAAQVWKAASQTDQGRQPQGSSRGLRGGRVNIQSRVSRASPAARWEQCGDRLCSSEVAWGVAQSSEIPTEAGSWLLLLQCSEVLKVMETRGPREAGVWAGNIIQVVRGFVKPELLRSRRRERIRVEMTGIFFYNVSWWRVISAGSVFSGWRKAPWGKVSGCGSFFCKWRFFVGVIGHVSTSVVQIPAHGSGISRDVWRVSVRWFAPPRRQTWSPGI